MRICSANSRLTYCVQDIVCLTAQILKVLRRNTKGLHNYIMVNARRSCGCIACRQCLIADRGRGYRKAMSFRGGRKPDVGIRSLNVSVLGVFCTKRRFLRIRIATPVCGLVRNDILDRSCVRKLNFRLFLWRNGNRLCLA